MEGAWADAVMSLKGEPNVVDIRTLGMVGAVDLAPRAEGPGKRGYEVIERAFHEEGLMMRTSGDTLVVTPPLIISKDQVGELVEKLGRVIEKTV